ncbi:MAG TPA: lysophospholipid acyltransferase family protein, partial [Candidatus Polarisedimenticolia bacterium]|nr:lysophospholipid acyltransferase family protein [Candidatus Polarisedimenticolia bacterium]
WARAAPVHAVRRLLEEALYRPFILLAARPRLEGLERLAGAGAPLLFVCNHHSQLDAGLFKALLPPALRGRIAPGMTTRHHPLFYTAAPGPVHRRAGQWIQVRLAEFFFHAWPIPQTGVRRSLEIAGELADAGWSLLIFPEGRHVPEGTMEPFRGGIGLYARQLGMPVVPAWLEGTGRVLPTGSFIPRPGRTRLVIGEPMAIDPEMDPAEIASRLEEAVRRLRPGPGSS